MKVINLKSCVKEKKTKYSKRPKTERSVWRTKQKQVRLSKVPISDTWALQFVRSKRLDHFSYIGSSIFYIKRSRLSNPTKLFGFQTSCEIGTISQPNQNKKRQNWNVRISDVYCMKSLVDNVAILNYITTVGWA